MRLVCLLFAFTLGSSATVSAQTYYARNPDNNGRLTLVGITNGTTWEVRTLPGNALVQQGTIARLSRVDVALNTTREFKLVTSRPVLAVLGYDCCNYSGSFFYPQEDGRKFWGRRFVFTPMANGANQQLVYARDPAVVRVLDVSGAQVAVSPTLAAGQRWQISGVVPGQSYSVESSAPVATTSAALIAIQANSGNGNTVVPPVATEANGLSEDCNNDRGLDFFFSTYAWARGSLAVFNPGPGNVTFSLQTITAGASTATAGYQNIAVAAGTAFLNTAANGFANLGTAQYRLTATGPVTLWTGDLEGGTGLGDMGDDLTSNFGNRGLSFLVHSQTQGATVFALEANTQVTWSRGGAPTVTTLNADGFLSLPANALYTLTSTRPVSVQTVGGNGLNDWALQLRPAQRLDTDGNGVSDLAEGGSCASVAPDTDGDGLYDFEDPDDDNDCLPDATDTSRLVASVPNANPNANCAAPTPVCDTSLGVCRGCLTTSDCTGGRVCNPTTLTCAVPPTTVITSQPANPTAANNGTFAFNSPGNPGATFQCSLDGAPFAPCSSPVTTGVLSEGTHVFRARAVLGPLVDPIGATITWLIDITSPPPPVIATPANGARLNVAQPVVTGTAQPGSTVTIFIDGVAVGTVVATTGSVSFTSPALADGTHVVSATARDAAGNTSASSAFNLFVIDRTAPVAPVVLTPLNGGTVGSATPTISGTAEAGSVVSVRVDGMILGAATADANGNWAFNTPIALGAGPHTVSARATDALGNQGPESSASSFTVDLTVLDTSIASGPAALSNSSTATFVFTSNKTGVSFECELDGMGFFACGNLSTFNALADGPHTLRVRAVRGAEIDPTPAVQAWSVDTGAPAAPTLDTPAPSATVATQRPTFRGTAGADELVTLTVDGLVVGTVTANALGGFSFTMPSNLADGPHVVRATTRDAAGNTSAPSLPRAFIVDTTAPIPPTVTSPVAGSTGSSDSPTFTGLAERDSSVAIEVDGVVVGTVTANALGQWSLLSPSPLADGPHTVRARAADAAGNQSAAGQAVAFSVDTTGPQTPALSTPTANAATSTNRPLVSGTADPGSLVTIRIDGVVVGTTAAGANGTFLFTPPTPLSDGPHSVTAQATDAVGNASPPSPAVAFTVDTVAPGAPVVTEPASGAIVGLVSPTVRGAAEANSIVTVIIDSVVAGTVVADASRAWTFTTAPLAQGQHSASATTRDAAGNTSPPASQVVFRVDTTVLDTGILTGPRSPTNLTSVTFGFSSNKTPVTFECRVDAAPFSACLNPGTVTGLSDGSHRLEVRARSSAVEVDPSPASYTWVQDTVAPTAPTLTAPAQGGALASNQVSVTGVAEPGSTVTVIIDSGIAGTVTALADGSWSLLVPINLGEGPHTASTQATDGANNTGPQSDVTVFTVDTQAPPAPVITLPLPNALLSSPTPTVSGTGEAGGQITVVIDGLTVGIVTVDANGRWTLPVTIPLNDGEHTASATARDAAGNTGPSSAPVAFATDTLAPGQPVITAPTQNSTTPDATPIIRGEAEPDARVGVVIDGVVVGATTADASGTWSLTLATALAEGPHSVRATATDAAGNASPTSPVTTFSVDTVAPVAPTITAPAPGSVIADPTPTITGTGEPSTTVRVFIDGVLIGTATTDVNGVWSVPVSSGQTLGEGPHEVRADATDAAGNRGPEGTSSVTVRFPVDAGSDGGIDGGIDAGLSDAGPDDGGTTDGGIEDGEDPLMPADLALRGGGCGCGATDASALFGLLGFLALLRRVRR